MTYVHEGQATALKFGLLPTNEYEFTVLAHGVESCTGLHSIPTVRTEDADGLTYILPVKDGKMNGKALVIPLYHEILHGASSVLSPH